MKTKLTKFLMPLSASLLFTFSTNAQDFGDEISEDHPRGNCGHYDDSKISSKTSAKEDPPVTVRLSWPLRQRAGLSDPGYYYLSNYIDHDPEVDKVLDYNGGTQTYDGHKGTDIVIAPYAWKKVQNDDVEVIAAAPGTIERHVDGNDHDHCAWGLPGASNSIRIRHADGTLAIYGHMKNGSLTTKKVGDKVVAGEYLGVVASSGNSTTPHLHFEIQSASGNTIDPWKGNYNETSEGLWRSQLAYMPSKVLYLAISDEITEHRSPSCPDVEKTHERYYYTPGEKVYFTTIYRHPKNGQITKGRILKPNGTEWKSWEVNNASCAKMCTKYKYFTLPTTVDAYGTWTYEIEYQGVKYTKKFGVRLDFDFNFPYPIDWTDPGYIDPSPIKFKTVQATPNPAQSELTLTLQNVSGPVNISLYNAVGEELNSFQENVAAETLTIPLDKVPSGFVIVKITGEGFSESLKIKKE